MNFFEKRQALEKALAACVRGDMFVHNACGFGSKRRAFISEVELEGVQLTVKVLSWTQFDVWENDWVPAEGGPTFCVDVMPGFINPPDSKGQMFFVSQETGVSITLRPTLVSWLTPFKGGQCEITVPGSEQSHIGLVTEIRFQDNYLVVEFAWGVELSYPEGEDMSYSVFDLRECRLKYDQIEVLGIDTQRRATIRGLTNDEILYFHLPKDGPLPIGPLQHLGLA